MDLIERQASLDAINTWPKYGVDERNRIVPWYEGLVPYVHLEDVVKAIVGLPSTQLGIIRCKDCIYGEQDKDGWWYCRSFGCQVGNEDGSGFCADAERREDG